MILHHQQAIEMAKLVDRRTDRPELRELAGSIESSQSQEITQMQGWLRGWGKPATPSEGHAGHGDTEMPGMMSQADMRRLMESTGTEFDLAFVEMVAAHHQGAVDMGGLAPRRHTTRRADQPGPTSRDRPAPAVEDGVVGCCHRVTGAGRRTSTPLASSSPPYQVGSCPHWRSEA